MPQILSLYLFTFFLPYAWASEYHRYEPIIKKQVHFWQKIFQSYPSTSLVIHDTTEPDLIIDIIDFIAYKEKFQLKALPTLKQREKIGRRYLDRYKVAINRFKRHGRRAVTKGLIERRIYEVYKRRSGALKRLFDGKAGIRSQTGLADTFIIAAKKAQTYMRFIEKTFETYSIPKFITRLPFVESMFNLNARSKVGASGIWQFMPATAKKYMYVNRLVDERNSPYKATRAAAMLLADNFQELSSWPLAITAYNHGLSGMTRAVKQTGSRSIGTIINNYKSRSFGFASKNFYSEVIAASIVYDQLISSKWVVPSLTQPSVVPISLDKSVSVSQILRFTPLDRQILEKNNPCIKKTTFAKNKYKPLPPFFTMYVPYDLERNIRLSLRNITGKPYSVGRR